MKTVTIAIPSLHRPDLTARCIDSIQKQTLPAAEWEIVVIENEARPDAILADPLPPNTRRIELITNEGTTGSINRAVSATESQYILLLNNDIDLAPDYIEKLARALEVDPKLGFAIGKLMRTTQPTHLDGAGDAILMAGAAYRLGNLDADHGQFDQPGPLLTACGAAVLYRRSAFVAGGSLDEQFFAYLDDVDLSLRAHLMGYLGVYVPDAVAWHVGSATLGGALHPLVIEYLTRNQIFLVLKDYPRPVFLRLLPRIAVYQLLWLLFVLRNGGLGSYFRGLFAVLRLSGSMRRKSRQLMSRRRLRDAELLNRLRDSERQIYDWQQTLPPQSRSSLLNLYFRIFPKP